MMENYQPKICYKKLRGFQNLKDDDKIKTNEFLSAAEEIVQVIETFGRLFTPVTSDMRCNIGKLISTYHQDQKKFAYLEHILEVEFKSNSNNTTEALIWLKRALNLILIFFKNILNDPIISENLRDHLKDAYEKTLKHHHGIFVKHTVTFIYRWVPKRSELLGSGDIHDENIKILSMLLNKMEKHIDKINFLLNDYPKLN